MRRTAPEEPIVSAAMPRIKADQTRDKCDWAQVQPHPMAEDPTSQVARLAPETDLRVSSPSLALLLGSRASHACGCFMNLSHFRHRVSFLILVAAAFLWAGVPYAHVPFEWFETLFHESSHALTAWLTGGQVSRIELHLDGSGLTWTAGGMGALVSFAGYAGAVFWGAGLYGLATAVSTRAARTVVIGLLVLGGLETFTWLAFSPGSWLIMGTMMGILALLLWRPAAGLARQALRFIGLYVLLSGIRSPTFQLAQGVAHSDAMDLRTLTWIPASVWVGLWVMLGALTLAVLYWREHRADGAARREALSPTLTTAGTKSGA